MHEGYFWLPSSKPEHKVPGTLTISDGGNIELEIIGLFEESFHGFNNDGDLGIVVGKVEKLGEVTLQDCFYTKRNFSFGGVSKSLVYVKRALVGKVYLDSSLRFHSVQFSVEGIDEWVGISGISVSDLDVKRSFVISYSPPEEVEVSLENDMTLKITYEWTHPGFPSTKEASVTQKTYFKLIANDESRPLEEFMSVVHRLNTLLCLAVNSIVSLDQVKAYEQAPNIEDNRGYQQPITLYYASLPYVKEAPKISWHRMLFRYGDVSDKFTAVVNNWLNAYGDIKHALNLYFSAKMGAHKYLDGKFLSLAQGLETYHRNTSSEKLMDDKIFDDLVKELTELCPTEHRKWLSGRLKYGNEISLNRRIKQIMEPYKEVFGTGKERKRIIRKIVDTRNYLTHYNESLKERAASGKELWLLTQKMEVLMELHFLQVLEFSLDEIKSIFGDNYRIKQKLSD